MRWIIDMPMIVEKVFISDEQIISVSKAMRRLSKFTYADVQRAFVEFGVDRQTAYRAADRWLQRKRKAGEILFKAKEWHRT